MTAVLTLIVFYVFRKDYQAIFDCLSNTSILMILMLLCMGMGYQLLDSAACFALIHEGNSTFRFWQAVEVSFLGIFGNVSTSAVGTLPLQSYYLYGHGVQVGSGIGMMAVEYILHKSAIFFYALAMVSANRKWLKDTIPELMVYIYVGIALCAVIIIAFSMICTWGRIQQLLLWGIGKLPDTEKWEERKSLWSRNLKALYGESKDILNNRACCRKVVLINFLKLAWLYFIPFLCMKTLNIAGISAGKSQVLSSIMLVIIGVLPNVAGVGPAEFAFLLIFTPYTGRIPASSALVLYRIATYFFPFMVSIAVFLKVRKSRKRDKENGD